jgi:hypothetical protein
MVNAMAQIDTLARVLGSGGEPLVGVSSLPVEGREFLRFLTALSLYVRGDVQRHRHAYPMRGNCSPCRDQRLAA